MTVVEQVIEMLRDLPLDRQEEVLAFVIRMQAKPTNNRRRSALGLWSDLDVRLTEQDIASCRREMWASFPRDIS